MFLKKLKTLNFQALIFAGILASTTSFAQNKEEEKVKAAAAVLDDFTGAQQKHPRPTAGSFQRHHYYPKNDQCGPVGRG
jgi:hypothetical protein